MKGLSRGDASIIFAAVFLCSAQASQAAPRGVFVDEAPSYQINVAHTGSTTLSTGFKTPLKLLWSTDLGTDLSYPVIGDGAVYVLGQSNHVLTALDMGTGKTRWSRGVPAGTSSSVVGPTYDNGTIFVTNTSNVLSAFATKNGKSKWETVLPLQPDSNTSPMAVNGQVYAVGNGEAGMFYAVSEADGTVLWQQSVENGGFSIPAYGNGAVYATYTCQYYKFDAATGHADWTYHGGSEGGGGIAPVYFNKKLYIQDEAGCGDIIAKSGNGNFKGSFKQSKSVGVFSNPTLFTSSKGKDLGLSITTQEIYGLVCWDAGTGKQKWSFDGDGALQASPIVVNGVIVVGSHDDGTVYFLNEKGKQVWSTQTPSVVTSFTAGEGALVVVSESFVSVYVPE